MGFPYLSGSSFATRRKRKENSLARPQQQRGGRLMQFFRPPSDLYLSFLSSVGDELIFIKSQDYIKANFLSSPAGYSKER